ncbi:MAG: amino acid dehydrogenase [Pseudomonadota bacterium]
MAALVAIHSTRLGPAAGGCRRWHYVDDESALADALRLSRGMTYKNAMAELPFGGGKAILVASAPTKTAEEFRAFGRLVNTLDGRYITAEDVGVTAEDMRQVREATPYVSGLPGSGDSGGDPSPWTALGVFLCIERAVRERRGSNGLRGARVGIQGLGSVGNRLAGLLHEAGARLTVSDLNAQRVAEAVQAFGADAAPVEAIHAMSMDVFAPCALGGVLNAAAIGELRATIVAGAANNQLADPEDAQRLHRRNILFLPDYVINAGGIIAVAREYRGEFRKDGVTREVHAIADRLTGILRQARLERLPPTRVADRMVEKMLQKQRTGSLAESTVPCTT